MVYKDLYLIKGKVLAGVGSVLMFMLFQMFLKMTDSVIAPIIAHAVIDTICNPLASMFLSEEIVDGKMFQIGLCMIASSLILGIPCWIYMAKHGAGHREEIATKEG